MDENNDTYFAALPCSSSVEGTRYLENTSFEIVARGVFMSRTDFARRSQKIRGTIGEIE